MFKQLFTVKYLKNLYYSGINWLQCRCSILWQEANFDIGEAINKKFWMTLSIMNEKYFFLIVRLQSLA